MSMVELQQAARGRAVDIDLECLRTLGMITPDGARTSAAEDFRVIKRPLLHAAAARGARQHANLIIVTSALPGEGKTYCAINLAMSIAMEKDHRVLLVDADVARPAVLGTLGIEPAPGLMDVLLDDEYRLSDLILRTNVPSLTLLPAGRSNRHSTELLASQAMLGLLDEIAGRYPDRVVVFDSPPLLMTTEASVLASRMGQVVLVIAAETTSQRAVKEALERLGTCERISLICNKARPMPAQYYQGYYT